MELNAIGIVEVNYYANAVVILDEMLKTAEIRLVSCHKKLGGRMIHLIVGGKISAVSEVIERAKSLESRVGTGNIKAAVTIGKPHNEVLKLMNLLEKQINS